MASEPKSDVIDRRYEFVLFFDVKDGNPNGDPDAGNAPRIDPETGEGLITDVCLKRKVRNFIQLTQGASEAAKPGYEIYVKERGILANEQRKAYKALDKTGDKHDNAAATVEKAQAWMCGHFFDVRAFGAVMSTGKAGEETPAAAETADGQAKPGKKPKSAGKPAGRTAAGTQKLWNCGQVRGPIQLSFARSIAPVLVMENAITRVALTNHDDTKRGQELGGDPEVASSGQFGRKSTIPYGLYRVHGFISPFLAKNTGFTKADLDVFWKALEHMFDHDHSASRGLMSSRELIIFEHDSALGSAPAHKLFARVTCSPKKTPGRKFEDYEIQVDGTSIEGVDIKRMQF